MDSWPGREAYSPSENLSFLAPSLCPRNVFPLNPRFIVESPVFYDFWSSWSGREDSFPFWTSHMKVLVLLDLNI